jgi:hypothetical protein
LNAALDAMNVDARTAWTILGVESKSAGYLPDRRPVILFESHQFHQHTGGAYDASHPGVSQPAWIHDYVGGAGEYTRLAEAYGLAPDAALMSASWGMGQILGSNYQMIGYASVEDMVADACASEGAQLKQFQSFLVAKEVLAPLTAQNWNQVATLYNGGGQVAEYAASLQASYDSLNNPAHLPDLDVRAAQLYLRFLSAPGPTPAWNPAQIDGLWGGHTQAALNAWQGAQGGALSNAVDPDVLAALAAALPPAADLNLA